MSLGRSQKGSQKRRATSLAVLIVLQALCAVFFVADVIGDVLNEDAGFLHLNLETLAALALCAGVVLMLIELRDMLRRMEVMDRGLQAARGEMSSLIEHHFTGWGLTVSEREVAMLVLKGFDNEAIAGIRGVATGTVRAQTAKIYAKAGVEGRAQLLSVFLDELLGKNAEPDHVTVDAR